MASRNPFDLLDDDTEDPSVVIAAAQEKKLAAEASAAKKPSAAAHNKPAKLPSKPLPPSQAVREARNEPVRRSARGQGRGDYYRGLLPGEMARSARDAENGFSLEVELKKSSERRRPDGIRGIYRMEKRDDVNNAEGFEWERTRRIFERRSGTGRGGGIKRDGAGRGNWGSPTDEITQEPVESVAESEANGAAEKPLAGEENGDADKETSVKEPEEKEPEEKQMTLEEYEKVLEGKRRALLSLQGEETKGLERKVDVKEFQSMQLVSKKKNDDEVFIQLGSKDRKKDSVAERVKKTVPIEEFLSDYRRRGRGYNRAREGNGGGCPMDYAAAAPAITDVRQFPVLGGQ